MHPFDVRLETIDRFLNCEIADHPIYDGLEMQVFDDARHGRGVLAFLTRRADGKADFYFSEGLELDRRTFAIGAGIGRWGTAAFESARLELHSDGVEAELAFDDDDGRRVHLTLDDRDGAPRRRCRLLAPVSAGIAQPASMMCVYLMGFDLVRTAGHARLSIDGEEVDTGHLPLEGLHHRRLIKVSQGLTVVHLNPAVDGPLGEGSLQAREGEHTARLRVEPAVPSLVESSPAKQVGTWALDIEGDRITGGHWHAERDGDWVELGMDATEPWRPAKLPPLVWAVTRLVPTFRQWPRTYRWSASLDLARTPPHIRSGWTCSGEQAAGYRGATGSS